MPLPENVQVPNPTVLDPDPAKCKPGHEVHTVRVRFTERFAYAYGGIDVVVYRKGQISDVSELCAQVAIENKKGELTDAELFDPMTAPRKLTGAPENKAR